VLLDARKLKMVESRQSSRVDFPSLKRAGVGRLRCKAEGYAS
jgi:hypothetical protein